MRLSAITAGVDAMTIIQSHCDDLGLPIEWHQILIKPHSHIKKIYMISLLIEGTVYTIEIEHNESSEKLYRWLYETLGG